MKDICSPVRIGDNVWIGTNCYISKGITIPSGCTLAANAVISRPFNDEISENSIIAGHPAKVISTGYTMIRGSMEWELMQHFKNTSEKEIKIDYS